MAIPARFRNMVLKNVRVSCYICVAVIIASCSDSPKTKPGQPLTGAQIYKANCTMCHGGDGKKGLSGAKDLSVSQLTLEEQVTIIKMGKGGMAGYRSVLSSKEIESVIAHVQTMRQ